MSKEEGGDNTTETFSKEDMEGKESKNEETTSMEVEEQRVVKDKEGGNGEEDLKKSAAKKETQIKTEFDDMEMDDLVNQHSKVLKILNKTLKKNQELEEEKTKIVNSTAKKTSNSLPKEQRERLETKKKKIMSNWKQYAMMAEKQGIKIALDFDNIEKVIDEHPELAGDLKALNILNSAAMQQASEAKEKMEKMEYELKIQAMELKKEREKSEKMEIAKKKAEKCERRAKELNELMSGNKKFSHPTSRITTSAASSKTGKKKVSRRDDSESDEDDDEQEMEVEEERSSKLSKKASSFLTNGSLKRKEKPYQNLNKSEASKNSKTNNGKKSSFSSNGEVSLVDRKYASYDEMVADVKMHCVKQLQQSKLVSRNHGDGNLIVSMASAKDTTNVFDDPLVNYACSMAQYTPETGGKDGVMHLDVERIGKIGMRGYNPNFFKKIFPQSTRF